MSNDATEPTVTRRRRKRPGRPNRAAASAKAAAILKAAGIDVEKCDPRQVLAAVALEASAPASARVAAAKALLAEAADRRDRAEQEKRDRELGLL